MKYYRKFDEFIDLNDFDQKNENNLNVQNSFFVIQNSKFVKKKKKNKFTKQIVFETNSINFTINNNNNKTKLQNETTTNF